MFVRSVMYEDNCLIGWSLLSYDDGSASSSLARCVLQPCCFKLQWTGGESCASGWSEEPTPPTADGRRSLVMLPDSFKLELSVTSLIRVRWFVDLCPIFVSFLTMEKGDSQQSLCAAVTPYPAHNCRCVQVKCLPPCRLHIKKGPGSQKRLVHGSLCALYKGQQYVFYAQTQFKLVSRRTKCGP